MSLLDHPEAQALLDDAILSPDTVRSCADRLTDFLQRYLPKFYRVEQRENAATVIRGLSAAWSARPVSRSRPRPPCRASRSSSSSAPASGTTRP
jgi:hypothetical protein